MENRNGLVVDVETTQATMAEREAALKMATRTIRLAARWGADKGYTTPPTSYNRCAR